MRRRGSSLCRQTKQLHAPPSVPGGMEPTRLSNQAGFTPIKTTLASEQPRQESVTKTVEWVTGAYSKLRTTMTAKNSSYPWTRNPERVLMNLVYSGR